MQEYRYEDYANVELLDEDAQQLFIYDNCDFVDVLRDAADGDEWTSAREEELSEVGRNSHSLPGKKELCIPVSGQLQKMWTRGRRLRKHEWWQISL